MVDEDQKGLEDEEFSESASDYFGDTYVNADNVEALDLIGIQTIDTVKPVGFHKDDGTSQTKLALGFENHKGSILALNQTNGKVMKVAYGDVWKEWLKKKVEIYTERIKFKGREMFSVRIRIPENKNV